MTSNQITKKEIKIVRYYGKGYTIQVASNWKVQQLQENQTDVTILPKKGRTYMDAARISKASLSKEQEYTLLEEKDISQENFKASMHKSSWYNADKDMMVFVREIFTETETEVFILSSTIPNSPDIAELDNTIAAMMNSFSFKK